MKPKAKKAWWVYVLLCRDGSFYTGVTNDVKKRVKAHKEGKGARYTRMKGVKKLISKEEVGDHGLALRREVQVKKLLRPRKEEYLRDPKGLPMPGLDQPWVRRDR